MTDTEQEDPSASEQPDVTDLILHDIQTGVLAPGSWLKQIDLEKRYRRARPEVRRALDRLALKRVVEHVPNRGYHVYEPDGRQAEEIAEIRIILETAIAERIVARAAEPEIHALRTLAEQFDQLILKGTVIELYEVNLAFHHLLVSLGGNQELTTLVAEIRQRASSAPVSQWRTRARIDQSAAEHHQIVDAIAARDAAELRRLITLHIGQP